MKTRKIFPAEPVSDFVYLELFRVTCTGQFPTLLIAILFTMVATIISVETRDPWIKAISVFGVSLSVVRTLFMTSYLRALRVSTDNLVEVKRAEKIYIAGSLLFAMALGALGGRTFFVGAQDLQLLIVTLLLGYAAGLVTRGFALYWNGTLSLCMASLPFIVASAAQVDTVYKVLALLLAVFLGGGLESIAYLHENYIQRINLQQKFSSLARNDELTGLFNRLALREGFEMLVRERVPGTLIAVHCLDLDRFKSVNDLYGHPVGDELLRLVSQRLTNVLRNHDVAARLGGDEFIVIQTDITEPWQAERLAQRLIESVTAPYKIGEIEVTIGTSIGIALGCSDMKDGELELNTLISQADAALYEVKRHNKGSFLIGGDRCED